MNESKHNNINSEILKLDDCLDIDHQLKYVWDIHNNKFVSCFSLNENNVEVNAQTSNRDEAFKIRRQQLIIKRQQEDAERRRIRYSRLTEEMLNKKRAVAAERQRRRRALLTKEQQKQERIKRAKSARIRYAHMTDEQILTERVCSAIRYRNKRNESDEQLQLRTEFNRLQREKRSVCRNDEQLLELKLGKTRSKQLNDYMFNAVKGRVNSDCLSDVLTEIDIDSEEKHSVDIDIDFESIICSNNISTIEWISEINEMTGLNIRQENIVNNSVYFKANSERIQQILPSIGQKQINSDECEVSVDKNITNYNKNSKVNLKDLLNRIVRRKFLIERNIKFLISMCDGMGINEIENLFDRQKVRIRCDDIYDCFWPQCNATFNSNIYLMDHLKLSHHKDNEINTNRNNSDDVFSNQSNEHTYVCRKCRQSFKNVDNLFDHVVMHIDKPFMCDFCENRFNSINELLYHRDYVHFKRKFNCDECDYRAKTSATLKNHKTTVHKNQEFVCMGSECNGQLVSSEVLLDCRKTRFRNGKCYECFWPECGASFKSTSGLDTHLKKHNGIQYRCEFPECAGKIFTLSQSLDIHLRCVHSNERPFVCDWPDCGARFKIKNFLTIHIKGVHKKQAIVKPYDNVIKCLHCDYETTSKQGAYFHKKRVHEKVKNYICDVLECYGKSFCTKRELNDHKNSVHSDKRPFVCDWPQCNSTFKLKNSLQIHLKKVHKPVKNKK